MQLNEGLEELGEKEVISGDEWKGAVFAWSAIETITLPSTLKRLEYQTFWYCKNLKRIEIPNGIEYIGEECFRDSGIEEITLPGTLREIGEKAFRDCKNLRTVYTQEGCAVDVGKQVGYQV